MCEVKGKKLLEVNVRERSKKTKMKIFRLANSLTFSIVTLVNQITVRCRWFNEKFSVFPIKELEVANSRLKSCLH
jgi:hypothetical protein